jgi:transcriptional regulator with XRE-family HTH domain
MPTTAVRDEITDEITDKVRAEILKQGLTQIQLAARMGVGQWWVSRRLNSDISARDLLRFAEALGVSVTKFLPSQRGRNVA